MAGRERTPWRPQVRAALVVLTSITRGCAPPSGEKSEHTGADEGDDCFGHRAVARPPLAARSRCPAGRAPWAGGRRGPAYCPGPFGRGDVVRGRGLKLTQRGVSICIAAYWARPVWPVRAGAIPTAGASCENRLLMLRPRIGGVLAVLVAAGLLSGVGGSASGSVAAAATASVVPGQSIGPVHLGESLRGVTRDLGRGWTVSPGFRRYQSGRLMITAGFSRAFRVTPLATNSPQARLYGHPLSEGYRRFSGLLRRRGWKTFRCSGVHVATLLGRHDTTSAQWGRKRFLELQVTSGRGSTGKCGLGSPANPVP